MLCVLYEVATDVCKYYVDELNAAECYVTLRVSNNRSIVRRSTKISEPDEHLTVRSNGVWRQSEQLAAT